VARRAVYAAELLREHRVLAKLDGYEGSVNVPASGPPVSIRTWHVGFDRKDPLRTLRGHRRSILSFAVARRGRICSPGGIRIEPL
jgi:hypothetical protein